MAGGRTGPREALDTVELIDLEKKTSTILCTMLRKRRLHTATVLPGTDPKSILFAGGGVGAAGRRNTCETFTVGDSKTREARHLCHDRNNHTATLMPGGVILFAGGYGHNTRKPLNQAELYIGSTAITK